MIRRAAALVAVLGLSSVAQAAEPESTSKLEEENKKLKSDLEQARGDAKLAEDAEAAKRFIRYGITAGIAYTIYTPFPAATRLDATHGGSITGYVATFPAYWFYPPSNAAYCAANWSASEKGARAAEAMAGGETSTSETAQILADARASIVDKADRLREDAKNAEKSIVDVAAKAGCKEKGDKKVPLDGAKQGWLEVCAANVPAIDATTWPELPDDKRNEVVVSGYCRAPAAARAASTSEEALVACRPDDAAAQKLVDETKSLVETRTKANKRAEEELSRAEALDLPEARETLKSDHAATRMKLRHGRLRDAYGRVVKDEWEDLADLCELDDKSVDWGKDAGKAQLLERCKGKLEEARKAGATHERALVEKRKALDEARASADVATRRREGLEQDAVRRQDELKQAQATLASAPKNTDQAKLAAANTEAAKRALDAVTGPLEEARKEESRHLAALATTKAALQVEEAVDVPDPAKAIEDFLSDAEKYEKFDDLVASAWEPSVAGECVPTMFGTYVGVGAPFDATVVLRDDPSTVLKDREVTPSVTFGLAFAPNALFTLLTGPMVGQVKRDDGTSASIWAWTIGFGGTLDVVNFLRQ